MSNRYYREWINENNKTTEHDRLSRAIDKARTKHDAKEIFKFGKSRNVQIVSPTPTQTSLPVQIPNLVPNSYLVINNGSIYHPQPIMVTDVGKYCIINGCVVIKKR